MQLDSTVFVSPILASDAIGAAQELKLVVNTPGLITPVGRQKKGTIIVRGIADFMGEAELNWSAINGDYTLTTTTDPSTKTFDLKAWKRYDFVSAADEAFSQMPGPLVKDAAMGLGRKGSLFCERQLAATLFNASNYGTSALTALTNGGGVQWSTPSTAKPDSDIKAAIVEYREQSNGDPQDLVISQTSLDAYCLCLQAQGVVFVTSGMANAELLVEDAAIARIRRLHKVNVIVGNARYNSAAAGLALSGAYVWGKGFWLGNLVGPRGIETDGGVMLSARAVGVFSGSMVDTGGLDVSAANIPIGMTQTFQLPPKNKGTVIAADAFLDFVSLSSLFGYYVSAVTA